MGPDVARTQIQDAVRARPQTDKIMSVAWIIVPILSPMVAIVLLFIGFLAFFFPTDPTVALVGGFGFIIAGFVVGLVLLSILNYFLIKRMNEHFKREPMLRRGVIEYLRATARQEGKDYLVASELATMESVHAEGEASDDQRGAVVWTVVGALVPFAILYVWYFLTKYPYQHDARWRAFSTQAQAAAAKVGLVTVAPSWKAVEKRSYFVYLVLTFITGFFIIYWYYVMIRDPNDHFRAQAQFEDVFVSAISAKGMGFGGPVYGPPAFPPSPPGMAPPPPLGQSPSGAFAPSVSQTEPRCRNCGAVLPPGAGFCTNCGAKT